MQSILTSDANIAPVFGVSHALFVEAALSSQMMAATYLSLVLVEKIQLLKMVIGLLGVQMNKLCCQVNPFLACGHCEHTVCRECHNNTMGAHWRHKDAVHFGNHCTVECCKLEEGHLLIVKDGISLLWLGVRRLGDLSLS